MGKKTKKQKANFPQALGRKETQRKICEHGAFMADEGKATKNAKASFPQTFGRKETQGKKCVHGAFMVDEEFERRFDACNDYLERHENLFESICRKHGKDSASVMHEVLTPGDDPGHVQEELKNAQLLLWKTFWVIHSDLVDDRLEKVILASATESLLNGNRQRAMITANIMFVLLMDRHPSFCKGKEPNSCGLSSTVFTYRGMISFVAKRIPCSCLDGLRLQAKQFAKTDLCCRCFSATAKEKLFVCARCKRVSYCSKECQKTHWSEEHKDECRILANLEKEEGSA